MAVPSTVESASSQLVITLTHGEPITLTGPGMWDGLQRAIDAKASWASFHLWDGKVAIRMDHIVSALLIP